MAPLWQIGDRVFEPGNPPWIMAIVNLTGDSFYAASRSADAGTAAAAAEGAVEEGARIVDLGAESTRPGSSPVTPEEEQRRLLPALREIRRRLPRTLLSVDTRHAETARAALAEGADILNDVTGLEDAAMAAVAAGAICGLVLMHRRGNFETMHQQPPLSDVVATVSEGLEAMLARARTAGVAAERIVLDPGFGFGKNGDENYPLFAGLGSWRGLGRPILVGVSRKSFLGRTLEGAPPERRLAASLAATAAAVLAGAAIMRTHDVRPTLEAARIAARIRDAST